MNRRAIIRAGGLAPFIMGNLPTGCAWAEESSYPAKAVELTVPISAGGTVDYAARLISDRLGKNLAQAVVVVNRPGAGGLIGMDYVAHSKPDGYRLLFATAGPITILPQRQSVMEELDPLKAFQVVALLYSTPLVVLVGKNSRFKTLQDLINYARRNPGRVTYGSTGIGSINHIAGELFSSLANVKLLHIPYKGTPPVLADMIGGRLDLYFPTLPSWELVRRKFTVLAVASSKRSVFAPQFPTAAEAGLPGFELDNWGGVFVPAATPKSVVDKLGQALEAIMKDPVLLAKFRAVGDEVDFRNGAAARRVVESEFTTIKNLVRERHLRFDN